MKDRRVYAKRDESPSCKLCDVCMHVSCQGTALTLALGVPPFHHRRKRQRAVPNCEQWFCWRSQTPHSYKSIVNVLRAEDAHDTSLLQLYQSTGQPLRYSALHCPWNSYS